MFFVLVIFGVLLLLSIWAQRWFGERLLLIVLRQKEGGSTFMTLAEHPQIAPTAVPIRSILIRLERRGWIRRVLLEGVAYFSLTTQGRAIEQKAKRLIRPFLRKPTLIK